MSHPPPFKKTTKAPLLFLEASNILRKLDNGGSYNRLIFNNRTCNPQGLAALVTRASQYRSLITRILDSTRLLTHVDGLDEWLARILVAQVCFGNGRISGQCWLVRRVLKYKKEILEALEKADIYNVRKLSQARGQKPRYVRVNTLKISTDDFIKILKDEGYSEISCPANYDEFLQLIKKKMLGKKASEIFVRDFHVKDMLVFPANTFFQDYWAYNEGMIVLQDKASCLQSCCVQPPPRSVILDMCSAPGMKTSLYAALIQNKGKIYAIEMNKLRFKDMMKILESLGVECVTALNKDAGTVGPSICQNVDYIVVDPSCSGSGMLGRSKTEDLETHLRLENQTSLAQPSSEDKSQTSNNHRVLMLQNLQTYLLKHALSNFPTARCVVYSTCSIDSKENEAVIERVISCAHLNNFELVDLSCKLKDWKHFGCADFEGGQKCVYTRHEDFVNGGFFAVFERRSAVKEEGVLEVGIKEEEKEEIDVSKQYFARINTLKISIDSAIQSFVDNGWAYLPLFQNSKIFVEDFRSNQENPEEKFFEHDFHIKELLVFPMGLKNSLAERFVSEEKLVLQDKASCMAVHLLDPQPGSVILNLSASSIGSTTSLIASRMRNQGRIYACNVLPRNSRRLSHQLQMEGVSCAEIIPVSGMNSSDANCPNVERILVFPASSESGSTHPAESKSSLNQFVSRQFSLLRHALSLFPLANRIVYATKSVNPEENEEIIDALLVFAKFQGYGLVDAVAHVEGWVNSRTPKYHCGEKCLMAQKDAEGFFVAIFEKNEGLEVSKQLGKQMKEGQLEDNAVLELESKTESDRKHDSNVLAESADVHKTENSVFVSESADVLRPCAANSAFAPKSTDFPRSTFAADSAIVSRSADAPKSASTAGSAFTPESTDCLRVPGESEILDTLESADVSNAANLCQAASQTEKIESRKRKIAARKERRAKAKWKKRVAKMAVKKAKKAMKKEINFNPREQLILGNPTVDIPRYSKFLQDLTDWNRSRSASKTVDVADTIGASIELKPEGTSKSKKLSRSAKASTFVPKYEDVPRSASAVDKKFVSKSANVPRFANAADSTFVLKSADALMSASSADVKRCSSVSVVDSGFWPISADALRVPKSQSTSAVNKVCHKRRKITDDVHPKEMINSPFSNVISSKSSFYVIDTQGAFVDKDDEKRNDDDCDEKYKWRKDNEESKIGSCFVIDTQGAVGDEDGAKRNDDENTKKKEWQIKATKKKEWKMKMTKKGRLKRNANAGKGISQFRYFKADKQISEGEWEGEKMKKNVVGKRSKKRNKVVRNAERQENENVDEACPIKGDDFRRSAKEILDKYKIKGNAKKRTLVGNQKSFDLNSGEGQVAKKRKRKKICKINKKAS